MKGAPDRIFSRCSKLLLDDKEVEFSDYWRQEVTKANDSFANMGERVLAFAKYELDPNDFTKQPPYEFEVQNWKQWKDVQVKEDSVKGWFPMYKLTLVGVVSLNDPPRPSVAHAVNVCR